MGYTELSKLPAKEAAIWEAAHVGDDGKQRQVTRKFAGLSSTGWATAEEFLEEVTDRLARWRDGRYEINEAAQIVADSNSQIIAVEFCKQMEEAAHVGKLKLRKNGIPLLDGALLLLRGRIWNTQVRQSDVNEWLHDTGAGFELVYPYLDTERQDVPEVLEPKPPETSQQRRTRWLAWREAEDGKRGALQRVFKRELLLNPRTDRSFIGKQIKVAEVEQTKAKQGGAMFGQLVQDGKRQG